MTFIVEGNTTHDYDTVNRELYTRIYTMNNCIRITSGGYNWEIRKDLPAEVMYELGIEW